jgi:hypothetical protein
MLLEALVFGKTSWVLAVCSVVCAYKARSAGIRELPAEARIYWWISIPLLVLLFVARGELCGWKLGSFQRYPECTQKDSPTPNDRSRE